MLFPPSGMREIRETLQDIAKASDYPERNSDHVHYAPLAEVYK